MYPNWIRNTLAIEIKNLQRELELLESTLPGHEVGGLPRLVFLLAVAHLRPGSI